MGKADFEFADHEGASNVQIDLINFIAAREHAWFTEDTFDPAVLPFWNEVRTVARLTTLDPDDWPEAGSTPNYPVKTRAELIGLAEMTRHSDGQCWMDSTAPEAYDCTRKDCPCSCHKTA